MIRMQDFLDLDIIISVNATLFYPIDNTDVCVQLLYPFGAVI